MAQLLQNGMDLLRQHRMNLVLIRFSGKHGSAAVWDIEELVAGAPHIFGPTTARSSSPRRYGPGIVCWPWHPYLSSSAVRGRTAMLNPAMENCGPNCSTANSSIRGTKPKSSLNAGAVTTIHTAHIVRWGIDHRPQRPACSHRSAYRRERTDSVAEQLEADHNRLPFRLGVLCR